MAGRDPEWPRTDLIQKKERPRVSTKRNFHLKRKKQPGPSSTIQRPDSDDEEEKGEEDKASRLVTIKNHCQGAIRKEQVLSSSEDDDGGSEDDDAGRLLKAKKLMSDRGDEPSRKRPRGEEDD
ncbi:RNA polymerase-associated protein LEO1 [Sigmodon hispidus]